MCLTNSENKLYHSRLCSRQVGKESEHSLGVIIEQAESEIAFVTEIAAKAVGLVIMVPSQASRRVGR
jgi:hypothetical protein